MASLKPLHFKIRQGDDVFREDKFVDLMMMSLGEEKTNIKCNIYASSGTADVSFFTAGKFNVWESEVQILDERYESVYRERGELACELYFEKYIPDLESEDYWNLCTIEVHRDGTHSIDFAYKPELDEEYEKETIESIGQELYDKYKREDEERRQQARLQPEPEREPETPSKVETFTVPELLGFIASELRTDIPSNWKELIVVAELFEEDGKLAVSMISHYITDGAPQRFTPSNNIGPMNALIKLQRLMAKDGHTWRKARLTFESQGGVKVEPLE
ncbi:hypothetical protein [Marinobacterium iners]|uniref:hypothetical protein n=1 Tax=Marinobacterium iners TaxID=48076 RepID=UPI00111496ED|nr:hypothetical protein [Marinobacterium iners]